MSQAAGETIGCPDCGHQNPRDGRFCGECGAELTRTCSSCGRENPAGQRFCNGCGEELGEAAGGAPPPTAAPPKPDPRTPAHLAAKARASAAALEGERKQVTVLFCDLVGSLELASRTDPEAWGEVMQRLFALACEAVHTYEGTVDKFTGDGAMALFGAPIAHEDHAARACHAALDLKDAFGAYAAELRTGQGLELELRIGLNSGEVVVGAIGEEAELDYTAIGHTVGLAERAEQLAEPGTVYLTESTARLLEGDFELRELGSFEPKGAGGQLNLFQLEGAAVEGGRGPSRHELSSFVGREAEIRALEEAREQAYAGSGQVVGIVGEHGVGKSRLCAEFAERCRERGMPVYHVAAQAQARSAPLMPVLALLRDFFGVGERESEVISRGKIETALLALDPALADELPLLFDFLAIADPERPVERMDPEARQRRLMALLRRLVRTQSAREPGLMVFEDLHWLDPASAAFLANHIEAAPGTPGLTVVNFRPEYRAEWMAHSYYRQLALAPLRGDVTEWLLGDLLGSDPSLDGLFELIAERSGGNPFFIEEIVQSLVEQGALVGERGARRLTREVDPDDVPASVQATLAARIDRLGAREKAVLGAASVLGREFSAPILEAVAELDAEKLSAALAALLGAELVQLRELHPTESYAFKHQLTQQVAYRSQLERRRRALHARAAEAIASQHPDRLDELAALTAGHWEAAGEELEAARWHARAAAWAGTGDPASALEHWRRVRELVDGLPESGETTALGLTARIFLLGFGWRLGIGVEEAAALFDEAEAMALRTGDVRSRVLLLAQYATVKSLGEGEFEEGAALTRRAFALAEESGDRALYVSLANLPYLLQLVGAYREALALAERAIELAGGDPTTAANTTMACPYAVCHTLRGGQLAVLGELEEAGRALTRGRELAREYGDTEALGWTRLYSSVREYYRGDPEAEHRHAERGVEIAERIGDSFSRAWSWSLLGGAEMGVGRFREAIESLERSRSISREHRTAVDGEPLRLAFLAASHLGLGELERAKEAAAEGVERARSRGHVEGEMQACLVQVRVLLASEGTAARSEIEGALDRELELVGRTGARVNEPQVHVRLAELAGELGDEVGRLRELREAHRLFCEIGAEGHAERIAGELAVARQV
jgi:class 3 adenylate cyclase/tetratricopeptide (TPR) repeat protein